MHCTFQGYYVVRYLLCQVPQYRKNFVRMHFTSPTWRELLLLAIASKSVENKTEVIEEYALQKIMAILADDERLRRPLDSPDYKVWRLDDVWFETLKALAD